MKKSVLLILGFACYLNASSQCFVKIASGEQHTMAIADDGTLWGWGSNTSGECGITPNQHVLEPTQVGTFNDWIDLDCGAYHSIALRSNGDAYTMGFNNNGQCGTGNNAVQYTPVLVASNVTNVATGKGYRSFIIKSDSTLWACGVNGGAFGNGSTANSSTFIQVSPSADWIDVAGGVSHSIAFNSIGEVYTTGSNLNGELGQGVPSGTSNFWYPVNFGNVSVVAIDAGVNFCMVLDQFGQVLTFGSNANGRLGRGTSSLLYDPTPGYVSGSGETFDKIKAGYNGGMAWRNTGANTYFYSWGKNDYTITSATVGDAYTPTLAAYTDTPVDASMGLFNIAVISDGDGVYNWGANDRGNCGDGTTINRSMPQLNNAVCAQANCAITLVSFVSQSSCDPQTNTYSRTIQVFYENNPSGNIIVNGQSFAVTTSPQTITLTGLPADASNNVYTIYFENDPNCSFNDGSGWIAPEACNGTSQLNEFTQNSLIVYPNPVSSAVNISLDKKETVTILNAQGKNITKLSGASEYVFDASHLDAGVYFIQTENGTTQKFIKE